MEAPTSSSTTSPSLDAVRPRRSGRRSLGTPSEVTQKPASTTSSAESTPTRRIKPSRASRSLPVVQSDGDTTMADWQAAGVEASAAPETSVPAMAVNDVAVVTGPDQTRPQAGPAPQRHEATNDLSPPSAGAGKNRSSPAANRSQSDTTPTRPAKPALKPSPRSSDGVLGSASLLSRQRSPSGVPCIQSPGQIEVGIREALKEKLTDTDKDGKFGQSYIIRARLKPRWRGGAAAAAQRTANESAEVQTNQEEPEGTAGKLYKIGCTGKTADKRSGQINRQCRVLETEARHFPKDGLVRLYHRLEKLVQAELAHLNRKLACPCGTEHREYFEVDEHVAREVLFRWKAFCALEPYGADGRLKPFWEHRLNAMGGYEAGETLGCIGKRARRWGRFCNPTAADLMHYGLAGFPRRGRRALAWVMAVMVVFRHIDLWSLLFLAVLTGELFGNTPMLDGRLLAWVFGFGVPDVAAYGGAKMPEFSNVESLSTGISESNVRDTDEAEGRIVPETSESTAAEVARGTGETLAAEVIVGVNDGDGDDGE